MGPGTIISDHIAVSIGIQTSILTENHSFLGFQGFCSTTLDGSTQLSLVILSVDTLGTLCLIGTTTCWFLFLQSTVGIHLDGFAVLRRAARAVTCMVRRSEQRGMRLQTVNDSFHQLGALSLGSYL